MRAAAPGAVRARATAALAAVLIVAVQALLWTAYYVDGTKRLIGDEQDYQRFALAILDGGSWMPSSIWPPLQPIFIAAIYAIFGVHVVAVQIVETILFFACAALLRFIWRRLGGSVRAANVATALFVLNPANAAYAQWLWPEVPHLFLVLLVFALLVARRESRVASALAGVAAGFALLTKSLLAAFWPVFLGAFVRRERPHLRIALALCFVAGLAVATAPALIEGARLYGKPMIADSSMYNLWIGLTDRFRVDYVDDQGARTLDAFVASGATPSERNAVYRDKVEALVAERGVVGIVAAQLGRQYFRLFSAKTPLVSQLPGAACAGHVSSYRTPPMLGATLTGLNDIVHALTLVGFAFGLACWRRRGDAVFWIIVAFIAYQLGLMLVLHVKARFLFPMMPFLCAFAGSFYAGVAPKHERESGTALALTPMRLGVGAIGAALLLSLAFAGPALDGLCS